MHEHGGDTEMKGHLQLPPRVEADSSQQQLNERRALHELYNRAAQHGEADDSSVASSHRGTTHGQDSEEKEFKNTLKRRA